MILETLSPWYSDTRPTWEAAVAAWLAQAGRSCSLGQIQSTTTVKKRPWSLVRRVTFERSVSYFKACSAAGRHEPALHLFLEEHFALHIPQSQAVDLDQGWILTAGAGLPLGQTLARVQQVQVFAGLLAQYAELQIVSLSLVQQLLEIGLPDRRCHRLSQLLDSLLSAGPLTPHQSPESWNTFCAAARRQMPLLEQVCEELDASRYSAALDHGDLHQGNVLVRDAEVRLSDWGDSCVTHPLCSMLVTLETVASTGSSNSSQKWANYLRDAYLEPWTALAPRIVLLADFRRALWLGQMLRALNFAHMLRGAPEEVLSRWRPLLPERLEVWVNDTPP